MPFIEPAQRVADGPPVLLAAGNEVKYGRDDIESELVAVCCELRLVNAAQNVHAAQALECRSPPHGHAGNEQVVLPPCRGLPRVPYSEPLAAAVPAPAGPVRNQRGYPQRPRNEGPAIGAPRDFPAGHVGVDMYKESHGHDLRTRARKRLTETSVSMALPHLIS